MSDRIKEIRERVEKANANGNSAAWVSPTEIRRDMEFLLAELESAKEKNITAALLCDEAREQLKRIQDENARLKAQLADALKVMTAETIEHLKNKPR